MSKVGNWQDAIKALSHDQLMAYCLSMYVNYEKEVRRNQELTERMNSIEKLIGELKDFSENPDRVR